jgi:hypothetical protein
VGHAGLRGLPRAPARDTRGEQRQDAAEHAANETRGRSGEIATGAVPKSAGTYPEAFRPLGGPERWRVAHRILGL